MAKKMKLKSKDVAVAKRELQKLIRHILETHKRGTAKVNGGFTVEKRTGNLFREIQPDFKLDNNKLVMEVSMMDYYQYLDAGTSKMRGWFFSEEIMDSKELEKLTEDLLYSTVEGKILDMISNIKK